MRQIAAFLILLALFVLLVGSRFQRADGDKLAAASRLALGKVRNALPPAAKLSGPVNVIRRELPEGVEDRVKTRLEAEKGLDGVGFAVTADGGAVTLRGVCPTPAARKRAVEVANSTVGVDAVVDELAVPVD